MGRKSKLIRRMGRMNGRYPSLLNIIETIPHPARVVVMEDLKKSLAQQLDDFKKEMVSVRSVCTMRL